MNKYDESLKQNIRQLRSSGMTYEEIQIEVGYIPKSSLTYICRGIVMDGDYMQKIKQANIEHLGRARLLAGDKIKQIREGGLNKILEEARRVVSSGDKIDGDKVSLAMLYLGEGRKSRSYSGLSLGGSDPVTLKIYLGLLKNCYGVDISVIKAAVQYRADQQLEELVQYWSNELGLSKSQFYSTRPDPRTIGKPTIRPGYMGVCVITCRGANIQVELSMIAEEYAKNIWGYSSAD